MTPKIEPDGPPRAPDPAVAPFVLPFGAARIGPTSELSAAALEGGG